MVFFNDALSVDFQVWMDDRYRMMSRQRACLKDRYLWQNFVVGVEKILMRCDEVWLWGTIGWNICTYVKVIAKRQY
jgi:hypothetical protein